MKLLVYLMPFLLASALFSKAYSQTADAKYEILNGNANISGEPEIMVKAARDSWKKACDDWKKETKELNIGNQVLAISCNEPNCSRNERSETVCTSRGSYSIKVKMRE